jgi:hypothetical protein
MDPPPRRLAADAYDCIMVPIRPGSTEYKFVARGRPRQWRAPLGIITQTPQISLTAKPVGMWTIGFADRRRSPLARASSKSREMLAFAHIPTGTTDNHRININGNIRGGSTAQRRAASIVSQTVV